MYFIEGADYSGSAVFENSEVEEIADKAFYFVRGNFTGYNFPNLKKVGKRTFGQSKIRNVYIKKGIEYDRGAFAECYGDLSKYELKIDDGVMKLPESLVGGYGGEILLPESLVLIEDGNIGYSSNQHITLGKNLAYFDDYFSDNVKRVVSKNPEPPIVGIDAMDSVAIVSKITLEVPMSSVEAYKAHEYWGHFGEIIGNPDFSATVEEHSMPSGLYYAEKGGNICYYNGNGTHDTGIISGGHPFQMQEYNGKIYVADAGDNHTLAEVSDGYLYCVSVTDDGFCRMDIANNDKQNYVVSGVTDFYTLSIDSDGYLYSSTMFDGIRKISVADNSWLSKDYIGGDECFGDENCYSYYVPYLKYGNYNNYRGIRTVGFQKDKNGVYWHAISDSYFPLPGIQRYTDADIAKHYGSNGYFSYNSYPAIASGSDLSAIYLDEANGYLYAFSKSDDTHGLYRVKIDAVENGGSELRGWELIDNSPAVDSYISQITGDGNYIYWSYIANEEKADSSNPLHESGIKMISAKGDATVSYVVKGVEAYGIAPYQFDVSGVESVSVDVESEIIGVSGNDIVAVVDARISVYTIGGMLQRVVGLNSGELLTLNNLSSGVYVVKAVSDESGLIQTAKIVIK